MCDCHRRMELVTDLTARSVGSVAVGGSARFWDVAEHVSSPIRVGAQIPGVGVMIEDVVAETEGLG